MFDFAARLPKAPRTLASKIFVPAEGTAIRIALLQPITQNTAVRLGNIHFHKINMEIIVALIPSEQPQQCCLLARNPRR